MLVDSDRRALLKTLGWATIAAGAGQAIGSIMPSAQTLPRSPTTRRLAFSRAPLQDGIIIHAGETAMELPREMDLICFSALTAYPWPCTHGIPDLLRSRPTPRHEAGSPPGISNR